MSNQPGSEGISLKGFVSASHGTGFSAYISALESFDRLEQMQELKALGHERTGIHADAHVLDVGCGFGLETLRLARLASPGGLVDGCDLSSDFLAEARRRATAPRSSPRARTGSRRRGIAGCVAQSSCR